MKDVPEASMIRTVMAVIGGLAVWAAVATVLDICLRLALPGYMHAEPLLAFTLPMKIGRLTLAVLASLAAGASVQAIAPNGRRLPWILGLLLLGVFLPVHIQIGARLPLWYHLFFLVTLAPLGAVGAQLVQPWSTRRKAHAGQYEGRDVRRAAAPKART